MFLKHIIKRLMEAAGEDGGASGGAATGTEGGAADGAASTATTGTEGSALQTMLGNEQPAIPDKFIVKNEDGSVNHEASSLKLAEAYANAEKRIGSGDLPPKAVGDYQITVPESLKDVWNPSEDPLLTGFLEKAHAAGYTQKQIDLAIEQYGQLAPGLVAGNAQLSADECVAALKEVWTTDADYKSNTEAVGRAINAYAGDDMDALLQAYGNDPLFLKFAARIGREVGEDTSVGARDLPGAETIQQLEMSEAYRNPKDPQHAAVSKRIADYYAAKTAQDKRAGNARLM